jgi:diguanylate cyclase (GGDEF)-like protein
MKNELAGSHFPERIVKRGRDLFFYALAGFVLALGIVLGAGLGAFAQDSDPGVGAPPLSQMPVADPAASGPATTDPAAENTSPVDNAAAVDHGVSVDNRVPTGAMSPQADAVASAVPESLRAHLLPGLLLGLLLGLAALHLARQVYSEAPGSLAAAGLLVMAFLFEYVSFGLHGPLFGRYAPHAEALATAGLAVAALSFLSGYLELPALGGAALWGTWGLLGFAGFAAVLAFFNTHLALYAGHVALAFAALWSAWLGIILGRRGDGRAGYLVPGLLLIVAAVVVAALMSVSLMGPGLGVALAHALFVIGLLLVAFAVESAEAPPERTYLALPAPAGAQAAVSAQAPQAEAAQAATTEAPAQGAGESAPSGLAAAAGPRPLDQQPQGPRQAHEMMLARVSERRLALALAASRHGLWDWNIGANRITISPETEKLLGLEPDTFDGNEETWLEAIHPEDRDGFRSEMARAVEAGEAPFALSFRVRTGEGEIRGATLDGACLSPGPDGRASRCIGMLVQTRADAVSPGQAAAQGAGEALTVPQGRGVLLEELDRRLAPSGAPDSGCWLLLLIDLDRFRSINEGFGHAVGDRVIEIMVGRLRAGLGPGELLMRLGGDEFALLLHDGLGKPPRGVRADRLIGLIGRPIPLDDGREVFASASIGVMPLDHEATSASSALKDAEAALLHVKRTGGGRFAIFSPEMRERTKLSGSLESELRRALEREEIELHYQPIMALADGRIAGFEALIRWRHAEHGILTAEAFVDLAEQSGLIVPLGKYALAMASVQLFQWQTFYPLAEPLFVCVNVSSRQLLRHDLVKDVRDVLAAVSLAPNSLRIEVNEQLVTADVPGAKIVLDEIKALGAGIALDDFGTGNTSLSMLETLPIDTIKVDKSFIARLRETQDSRQVVVRSIVDLAHDLEMDVVAEGIESETDVRRLRALGCEFGQGFYFGSAMPPEDVQTFIARHWSN